MKKLIFTTIVLSVAFGACSEDSSSSSSTTNDFLAAQNLIVDNAPSLTTSSSVVVNLPTGAIVSDKWETAGSFPTPGPDWGNPLSMKDSLGAHLNEENSDSVFGRMKTPFMIACVMDVLATKDSDGNLEVGTQTINIDVSNSEVVACFDGDSESQDMVGGQDITFTVTATSNSTYYDRHVDMPCSSNSFFGSNQEMYVRNTSSELNFQHLEFRSEDSCSTFTQNIQWQAIAYDKSAQNVGFQYLNDGFDMGDYLTIYRVWIDVANTQGRLIAFLGDSDNTADEWIEFAMTANALPPTLIGTSVSWDLTDQGGSSFNGTGNQTGTDNEACVSTSDGSISTDDDITATACGTAGISASTITMDAAVRAFTMQSEYTPGETTGAGGFGYSDIATVSWQ